MSTFLAFVLALAACVSTDDADVVLGILAGAPEDPASGAAGFVRAAQEAVDAQNAAGGVRGRAVVLRVEDHSGTEAGVKKALERLDGAGALAVAGPLDAGLADVADRAAAARRLPLLRVAPSPSAAGAAAAEFLRGQLRARRVGLFSDGSRDAKEFQRALEDGLEHPYGVTFVLPVDADEKLTKKRLERTPVDVLVVDASAADAVAAVDGSLGRTRLPVLLSPRAAADGEASFAQPTLALLGRSPATVSSAAAFLGAWRNAHGEPAFGVGEGADAAALLLAAVDAASAPTRDAVSAALVDRTYSGTRGPVRIDAGSPAVLAAPLAVWRLVGGRATAYLPPPIPAEVLAQGTGAQRDVDPTLGVPFGAWRTDRFEVEEKTQWVLFHFGEPGESTIDEDLRALGLSSSGAAPLVDHLVKEELMARLLGVNATKWLRNEDGTAIPGKSLRISFATHLPEKAKRGKVWVAVVAGDDEAAGGRAYPGSGRAEIYSTFIRRTIYQPHALDPPVGEDDLPYLDGSYRFGTDRARDKRSELIRSLVNAFAGSMALTAAHEIGHLSGLDHVTHDPFAIMNVEEGAGIDHADGRFCPESLEILVQRFGVVPE